MNLNDMGMKTTKGNAEPTDFLGSGNESRQGHPGTSSGDAGRRKKRRRSVVRNQRVRCTVRGKPSQ